MSRRTAALALVTAVSLAAPAAGGAAVTSSGSDHAATAAKCKMATVGGKRTCLAVGKSCKRKYQKQYTRAGFSCARTNGRYRLVVNKQSF